jgi:SsrA-binding protein
MAKKHKAKDDNTLICANKRAHFEFEITEKFEAGISLMGSEVKSLRQGGATIAESFAAIRNGELFLIDSHIPPFRQASIFNHEPRRPRKLLLHKREIKGLDQQTARKGLTIVPLRMYFTKRGYVKIQIGLGRGKKLYDKRQDLKAKSAKRDMERTPL